LVVGLVVGSPFDTFGAKEGQIATLREEETSATRGGRGGRAVTGFKKPTTDKMSRVYDPGKLSAKDWQEIEAESGKDQIRGDGEGKLGRKEFARAQSWNDAHRDGATSAVQAAQASGAELARLKKAGKVDAEGCPYGVGAYGFNQYPSLSGVITVNNSFAVVLLHNYDFNDHWIKQNDESFQDIVSHVKEEVLFPFEERTFLGHGSDRPIFSVFSYCPSYSANGGRSRMTFEGQSRFSCIFADGTVAQATDRAADEVTCATTLRVWCPIPPSVQKSLARGQRLVEGVQLVRRHLDPKYISADQAEEKGTAETVYPVAELCPRPNVKKPAKAKAKKARLAICAQYDPSWDTQKKVEEWLLWNLAVGVEHIFLYYLEGQTDDMPVPGAGKSGGVLGVQDQPDFDSLFKAAQSSGRVTIRKWDRWPNWWFNTTWATRWDNDKKRPERDWRLVTREGYMEMMQVPIYNDCQVRSHGHAEWLTHLDVDEFLHPMGRQGEGVCCRCALCKVCAVPVVCGG
jgi:hypothetical protein